MAQGQSVKEVGLRGQRNVPPPPVHPCLFGGLLVTPTGWVGGPGSLSVSFVSLSLSDLSELRIALASDPQGALSLLPSPESGPESLLLSACTQWMFRS